MSKEKVPFDQRTCTQEERTAFLSIQNAVIQHEPLTVRFTYTKADGEVTDRHVEPYEVIGGDKPQLAAWDIDKDALRRFLLAGMTDVMLGSPFKARFPIKIMI